MQDDAMAATYYRQHLSKFFAMDDTRITHCTVINAMLPDWPAKHAKHANLWIVKLACMPSSLHAFFSTLPVLRLAIVLTACCCVPSK